MTTTEQPTSKTPLQWRPSGNLCHQIVAPEIIPPGECSNGFERTEQNRPRHGPHAARRASLMDGKHSLEARLQAHLENEHRTCKGCQARDTGLGLPSLEVWGLFF